MWRDVVSGEKRRVSIGVDTVQQPTIIFLDEPTSGLGESVSRHHRHHHLSQQYIASKHRIAHSVLSHTVLLYLMLFQVASQLLSIQAPELT